MTSTAVLTMFLVLHECYVMLHQFLYLSALFHFMFNAVLYTFKGFSLWPSPSLFFTIAWNCRGFDGNAQYTKMSYIWTPKYYTFMAIHYTRVSVIEWNRRFGCTLVSRHPITIVSGCTTNTKLKSFHLKLLDFYFPLFILIRLFFFFVLVILRCQKGMSPQTLHWWTVSSVKILRSPLTWKTVQSSMKIDSSLSLLVCRLRDGMFRLLSAVVPVYYRFPSLPSSPSPSIVIAF